MQRGSGLSRFRSAPATWLEALLESDTENDVVLQPPILPEIKTETGRDMSLFDSGGGGGGGFLRQNSSPAEFLSDAYFSAYGMDFLSPSNSDASLSNKRPREPDSPTPHLKREPGGQLRGSGGSMDAEMEKLMEDLVPCKVRAKRGCATHPRSIAERVRRTRISDRIRKLQELVPNMDKQTNTADMLEEAVEYVKFLQKQIQELTEHQKKCTCSVKDQ